MLDPAKYAAAIRRLTAEAHEICDKLSLVEPLPWNLRIVHALALYCLADLQAEDGLRPDLERLFEAERLWKGLLQQAPTYPLARANLAIVRRRIAHELLDRGRPDDAVPWDRSSLETVRRDPDLLYEIALIYAQEAGRVDNTRPSWMPGSSASGAGDSRPMPWRCSARRSPTASTTLRASRASRCSTRSVRIPTSERPWPTWSSPPIHSRPPDWISRSSRCSTIDLTYFRFVSSAKRVEDWSGFRSGSVAASCAGKPAWIA